MHGYIEKYQGVKIDDLKPDEYKYDGKLAKKLNLDSDEFIVCEYKTTQFFNTFVLIVLIVPISFVCASIVSDMNIISKIIAISLCIYLTVLLFKRTIINLFYRKFYVTNKNIIVRNNIKKVPLDEIYIFQLYTRYVNYLQICNNNKFRSYFGGRIKLVDSNFILQVPAWISDKKFNNLLVSLYYVSKNREILWHGCYELENLSGITKEWFIIPEPWNEPKFEKLIKND